MSGSRSRTIFLDLCVWLRFNAAFKAALGDEFQQVRLCLVFRLLSLGGYSFYRASDAWPERR